MNELLEKWLNDPAFRQALLHDPEQAVRDIQISLDGLSWSLVRCLDWSQPKESLEAQCRRLGVSPSPSPDSIQIFTPEVSAQSTGDWSYLEYLFKLYKLGLVSTAKYNHLLNAFLQEGQLEESWTSN